MDNEKITFSLETFEGPLDLLLSLINKNKVSIYDIPIALIFEQYMEYIDRMESLNMEVTGDFIDMASRLMLIKSKMLLPVDNTKNEEDPRKELVDALLEYKRAKLEAEILRNRYSEYQGRYVKETTEVGPDKSYICDHSIDLLMSSWDRIILRNKTIKENCSPQSYKNLNVIIKKKVIPVQVKVFELLRYLVKKKCDSFENIVSLSETRSDLVALFLACLNLIRNGRIIIFERENDVFLSILNNGELYG